MLKGLKFGLLLVALLCSATFLFGASSITFQAVDGGLPAQVTQGEKLPPLHYKLMNLNNAPTYYKMSTFVDSTGQAQITSTTCDTSGQMKGILLPNGSCDIYIQFTAKIIGDYAQTIAEATRQVPIELSLKTTVLNPAPQAITVDTNISLNDGATPTTTNFTVTLTGSQSTTKTVGFGKNQFGSIQSGTYKITVAPTEVTTSDGTKYDFSSFSQDLEHDGDTVNIVYQKFTPSPQVDVIVNIQNIPVAPGVNLFNVILNNLDNSHLDVTKMVQLGNNTFNGVTISDLTKGQKGYTYDAPNYTISGTSTVLCPTSLTGPFSITSSGPNDVVIAYSTNNCQPVDATVTITGDLGNLHSTTAMVAPLDLQGNTPLHYDVMKADGSAQSLGKIKQDNYTVVAPTQMTVTVDNVQYELVNKGPFTISASSKNIDLAYNKKSPPPTPGYMFIAPYVDMTDEAIWSGEKPLPSLARFMLQSDNPAKFYVLAFLGQDSYTSICRASWGGNNVDPTPGKGGSPDLVIGWGADQIKTLRSQGGDVAISFGGENGSYVANACTPTELLAIFRNTYTTYKPAYFDFDVEGAHLEETTANQKRNTALAQLQKEHSDVHVSFTLPANINGLALDALPLIQDAVKQGVNITQINLMTMAWYAQKLPGQPIEKSIEASVEAAIVQLQSIYPNITKDKLYHLIRVTPRLGYDYDNSLFTFDDAANLTLYAKKVGLAGISYWSLNVDYNSNLTKSDPLPAVCSTRKAQGDYSCVTQDPFEYTATFLK
jgi:hypothetical protein